MNKQQFLQVWKKVEKIFFWVFMAHVLFFIWFIVQKISVQGFVVQNLKAKVLWVCTGIAALSLFYYFILRKISAIHKIAVLLRDIFFIGYISSFIYLLMGFVINPPVTLTQLGSLISFNGLSRDYISYHNMGRNIKLAVIAAEDQLFTDHDGFDLIAIKKAVKYNQKHPNKIRGASTISQQAAKNIFLFQGGGFFRKGLEVYFTATIEALWPKKTILARYLNIAEMGPGIFGVQAAAKKYFNKDAINLTRQEAAMIAACLPNPKKYTVKPLSNYVKYRSAAILRQMNNLAGDPDIAALVQ